MKIRTKEELFDYLDKDFSWRQKELTNLRNSVKTSSGNQLSTSLRSAVVLLYAHWEGFIKSAAETYLSYVKSHKLRLNELDNCFLALSIKQKLRKFESTSKSTAHVQFINYIFSSLDDRANFNDENIIKTNSNLNYSTLVQILTSVGIDCTRFELKEHLIDAKLLNKRNNIAHGQYLSIDKNDYDELQYQVIAILKEIKTEFQNAAVLESFKKKI